MASIQADGITEPFAKPRSFRVLTTLFAAHKDCLRMIWFRLALDARTASIVKAGIPVMISKAKRDPVMQNRRHRDILAMAEMLCFE